MAKFTVSKALSELAYIHLCMGESLSEIAENVTYQATGKDICLYGEDLFVVKRALERGFSELLKNKQGTFDRYVEYYCDPERIDETFLNAEYTRTTKLEECVAYKCAVALCDYAKEAGFSKEYRDNISHLVDYFKKSDFNTLAFACQIACEYWRHVETTGLKTNDAFTVGHPVCPNEERAGEVIYACNSRIKNLATSIRSLFSVDDNGKLYADLVGYRGFYTNDDNTCIGDYYPVTEVIEKVTFDDTLSVRDAGMRLAKAMDRAANKILSLAKKYEWLTSYKRSEENDFPVLEEEELR